MIVYSCNFTKRKFIFMAESFSVVAWKCKNKEESGRYVVMEMFLLDFLWRCEQVSTHPR